MKNAKGSIFMTVVRASCALIAYGMVEPIVEKILPDYGQEISITHL